MSHLFYRYPIRFGALLGGNELPTCDLGASISQLLHLLVHTRFGELRADPTFGCRVWDEEFDSHLTDGQWEDALTESLREAVLRHEPRLRHPQVSVSLGAVDSDSPRTRLSQYRKRADIRVQAVISETDERFVFTTSLFVGPLAAGH